MFNFNFYYINEPKPKPKAQPKTPSPSPNPKAQAQSPHIIAVLRKLPNYPRRNGRLGFQALYIFIVSFDSKAYDSNFRDSWLLGFVALGFDLIFDLIRLSFQLQVVRSFDRILGGFVLEAYIDSLSFGGFILSRFCAITSLVPLAWVHCP